MVTKKKTSKTKKSVSKKIEPEDTNLTINSIDDKVYGFLPEVDVARLKSLPKATDVVYTYEYNDKQNTKAFKRLEALYIGKTVEFSAPLALDSGIFEEKLKEAKDEAYRQFANQVSYLLSSFNIVARLAPMMELELARTSPSLRVLFLFYCFIEEIPTNSQSLTEYYSDYGFFDANSGVTPGYLTYSQKMDKLIFALTNVLSGFEDLVLSDLEDEDRLATKQLYPEIIHAEEALKEVEQGYDTDKVLRLNLGEE